MWQNDRLWSESDALHMLAELWGDFFKDFFGEVASSNAFVEFDELDDIAQARIASVIS
jgi:hypothetical protein